MRIQWLPTDTNNFVYLSRNLEDTRSIEGKVEVQFGQWKHPVLVKINDELPNDTIAIPEFIFKQQNIPTKLPYEIILEHHRIKIGPVIGVICSYNRFFNQESVGRTADYDKIKGFFFVCKPKDIDFTNETITGFYYDPSGKTRKTKWIESTFPFPDVLFNRRKKLKKGVYHQLNKRNVEVINSHYLNKWQQFKVFSENPTVASSVPETMKLSKPALIKMMEKYHQVYVKPTSKANGAGIRVIDKKENGYVLTENNASTQFFRTLDALYKSIKRKGYILQQSVAFQTENRNVDFRAVLQKDETKTWCYTVLACKISLENSIITNDKQRETVRPGLEALQTLYQLSPQQAKEKEKEIVRLCEHLIKTIEAEGVHLGDVAFDIILDAQLKLWVLEIQIRYRVFKKGDVDPALFHKSIVTPVYYAKAVAGF